MRAWLAPIPDGERDAVTGDLGEEFRVRRRRSGPVRATWWYLGEAARSMWPLMTMDMGLRGREGRMIGIGDDVRGALRSFRRAPTYVAVVVLTLAVGVGGTTAVYGVIRGVLLSPLAFDHADRVVVLWGQTPDYPRMPLTVGDYNALADNVVAFEETTAAWGNNALFLGEGEAEQVSVGWVTPGYFEVLGVHPTLGRDLVEDNTWAILLSHDLWDVAATRFASLLLSVFGAVALALATVGLHGVVAYSVRRRAREFGIRVALGADQGDLLRGTVRSGAGLVLGGIAVGTALSLGAGRVLRSVLFEVQPSDALTFVAAAGVMLAVGLLSAWLPARLVLGMDPSSTLRQE